MINVHWVILGAVLSLAGGLAYIRDTLRGLTHPNRVTWLLWGVAPMIAFAAELHDGVGLRSLMTFMVGLLPLLVFGASFVNRNAVWRISRMDWICGGLSVAGTVVWLLTRQGLVAIAAALAADLLAGIPTIIKSWRSPDTETSFAFLGGLCNAAITLLTITQWNAANAAFPLYIAVIDSLEVTLVAGRLGPRLRARSGAPSDAPSGASSDGPSASVAADRRPPQAPATQEAGA